MSPARDAVLLVSACAALLWACSEPPETRRETESLRLALARIGGLYEWDGNIKQYVFSDKLAVEKLVEAASDETIRELVECLDDTRPSTTTLKGQAVPTGIVCYQALAQVVYYEPTTADGDIAERWPGYLEPTASAAELEAAKRAWTAVVEKKAYKRL